MTFPGRATRWRALQRIVRLGVARVWLAFVPSQAVAARVAVLLSDDATPYQEVYQVFRAYLDDTPHEAVRVYAERLTPAALNDARLVVAVGVGAAEALAALPERPPVQTKQEPRAWYLKTGRARLGSSSRRGQSDLYRGAPVGGPAR